MRQIIKGSLKPLIFNVVFLHLERAALRDPKRKPTHPGAVLREDVLPALCMTQTEFARRLGVSRLTA